MKWEEVRKIYPGRFVKMQVLEGHIENGVRYIDDIAVIKAFDDNKEATMELARAKNDIIVFHTSNEKLEIPIKKIFGFRGVS
ncbi:hypothetical protein DFR58_10757 [Anaerobacterium chartisolvens]|uniref:Uncharacterized protein n=1 Tax=Anaerobacterium chartisolvens TaxID=1297424 RepID=A0A369B7K9_9FIRM|nr:hypothetical protein [Anaerobacterium chartisolvens]RCX17512.1 hypothetical protein DFR58_10757 [Anaerobacterium chartisolvens]